MSSSVEAWQADLDLALLGGDPRVVARFAQRAVDRIGHGEATIDSLTARVEAAERATFDYSAVVLERDGWKREAEAGRRLLSIIGSELDHPSIDAKFDLQEQYQAARAANGGG